MDEKTWKNQIGARKKEIKDDLVARVLKEDSLTNRLLRLFSTQLGSYFLNELWNVYSIKQNFGVRDVLGLYLLEQSGFVKQDKQYELTDEGKQVFENYFSEVLMKLGQGPDQEEKRARMLQDREDALKYEGPDYLNTRRKILMAHGLQGLDEYFAEIKKRREQEK